MGRQQTNRPSPTWPQNFNPQGVLWPNQGYQNWMELGRTTGLGRDYFTRPPGFSPQQLALNYDPVAPELWYRGGYKYGGR